MNGTLEALGLNEPGNYYKGTWEDYGFHTVKDGHKGRTTPSIQRMMQTPGYREKAMGFTQKKLAELSRKAAVDSSLVQNNVPILFDPEIFDIFTGAAPLLANVPMKGWDGYTVKSNRIDSRDAPLGYKAESAVLDLSAETGQSFTPGVASTDLKIYADVVNISDFTQKVSQFFIDWADTTLGTRVREHAQLKEQAVLYGDPTQALSDGSPGDTNAFSGLSSLYTTTNKSAVDISASKALLKDIKAEIKDLLQSGYNVQASDLMVFTSWSLHDYLENEMTVSERVMVGENSFNFGFEGITIMGVPVIPSHNVAAQSYGSGAYTPGDEGDVFIYNSRATQWYDIAPLSIMPLGRLGLAERAALYEYGVLHERADGNWGKYLQAYNI